MVIRKLKEVGEGGSIVDGLLSMAAVPNWIGIQLFGGPFLAKLLFNIQPSISRGAGLHLGKGNRAST